MPETPSYLGLLNGIASFESRAERYFSAWADATSNDELRAVLRTVAAREGEHGMAFAKRINELGFLHTPVDDPGFDNQMAIASSDLSDIEKAEQLGVTKYLGEPASPISTPSSPTTRSTSAPASCSAATSPRSTTPSACSPAATTSCSARPRPVPRRRPPRPT